VLAEHIRSSNPQRYHKRVLAQALSFERTMFYYHSKMAGRDKLVAVEVERIHDEIDDTLGHKKLATLMGMGKNRVYRVMKKHGLKPRLRKKGYHYHGKSATTQPNLANREDYKDSLDHGIVYSDIFEFKLADGCVLRGCFALLKQARQVLSLIFDYSIKAGLVQATIRAIDSLPPEASIWHSDQGKQYGAEKTIEQVVAKGLIPSMSRAGTPTDNPFAERFVSTFKHAVVKKRPYYSLGDFLEAAQHWINFYNHDRPHEGIENLSPNNYARKYDWPVVPSITRLTVE